ncbi:LysM peptidoglycan-binding domain-containing protein [Enterovibrio sp. ZSDZ35]|uniref:LysM peptidoglycan-binding domain-containing protein n=1 Tax=Enterovibrio qingdaonensis TaxID=2899818 RepID=A0ABT5QT96_9GAMM|nr:LysM peptidoglycan-binding domain-containing protein [Enterovibrio sp. ZSDZ35]MDD1784129.1 LysM peptidoglycan-binding domain-containing protein [Enterovibrio sp. ZSDZ35]
MKFRFVLVGSMFLAGCQLTGQENVASTTNTPDAPEETLTQVAVTSPQQPVIEEVVVPVITPQTQEDVWERIAMQMQMPIPENKRVNYYRNWYLKHPQHLETVSKRAEPFLYLITKRVEERGIPLEIALLPVVESSFDQFAYSHGRAAGLWQFVPDTGRRFGLEQNWWYDGRRDVIASTDAALDLLEYLHKKFDGDWLHALAAYNTGEGRVFRAIRNNKAKGLPTDFWHLSLPKETSGYVPKLLAVADVIKNKEKYGLNLPEIANKPVVEQVEPKVQMDLALAASYAGLPLSELQSLNPAYNHWATSPDGPNHLLLPKDNIAQFKNKLAENNNKGIKVTRYKVKSGDSLGMIAQRHNTTVKVIQRANSISGTDIRAGQHLLIPVSVKDESQYSLSAPQRLAKLTSKKRGDYKVTYEVAKGDSFWTIARKNDVSVSSLARWNGMSPKDPLHIGQDLVIWKKAAEGARIRTIVYQIREGDSLSGIAARYKVSVSDLVKWNSLKKSAYIKPGQKLKLYIDVTKVSA